MKLDARWHVVHRTTYGRDLALAIARELVVFRVRSAGQTQFSTALASYGNESERMRKATEFIMGQLEAGVTAEQVAAHVCLSTRQLALRAFIDFAKARGGGLEAA